MSLTAMLASAAAPAAVNLAANFLTSPKETPYERDLRGLAAYYKRQASSPYLQTAEAQSQTRALDEADKKNRKRTNNQGLRVGGTTESKAANNQAANEAKAQGMNRIAGRAGRYRDRKLSQYMQALGGAEQARQNSEAQWQQQVGAVTQGVSQVAAGYMENFYDQKKEG